MPERLVRKKAVPSKWRDIISYVRRYYSLYLMVLPGLVGFLIFGYGPMVGLLLAFKDYDLLSGLWGSPWVGLRWFQGFFEDPFFFRLVRNTFLLGTLSLLFGFPMPIILALLLNEVRVTWFKRLVQSISFLPFFIATVVVVGMIHMMFSTDGVINRVLVENGTERVNFLGSPGWFRPLYIGSEVWQFTGYFAILYLAALTRIDPHLYEAAMMDGASRWHRLWYITFPGIMPTISVLFILSLARVVSVGFERVFLLYNPATYETADVIATYVYRRGIIGRNFGYATAVGIFNAVIALVLTVGANTILRRVGSEETTATLW